MIAMYPSCFPFLAELNVKAPAFDDKNDDSFAKETENHKVLFSKTSTVDDPYNFLPASLAKLMHQWHPPSTDR